MSAVHWYGDTYGDLTLCGGCFMQGDELDVKELLPEQVDGVRLECDGCRILQVPEGDPESEPGVHLGGGVILPLRA